MEKTNRKLFIKGSLISSSFALMFNSAYANKPTPKEIEGPFYPLQAQKDKDFDLTIIKGHNKRAEGKVVTIEGQILDTHGNPIENSTVDLWQANSFGKYRHPHDSSKAALDPNFQGWAIVQSGKNGFFRFKTIIPGTYPVSNDWTRPPHIHFKVSKKGYIEVITQMYFPNNKLNKVDLLLNRKKPQERVLMIATNVKNKPNTLNYNIILDKA